MKIKIVLTKGDPITVTEEQAKAILSSQEALIAIRDDKGVWNGDVIHKAHIVQMTRDVQAEREDRLRNPRIEEPIKRSGEVVDVRTMRPRIMRDIEL